MKFLPAHCAALAMLTGAATMAADEQKHEPAADHAHADHAAHHTHSVPAPSDDPHHHHAAQALRPKDRQEALPNEMEGVGIDDTRLGSTLPSNLVFVDDEGRNVRLDSYFDGERPVLLTLAYFSCPAICKPLMEMLADTLSKLDMSLGSQYQVLAVSIDPEETSTLTKVTKQRMINRVTRPGVKDGWHFLRGSQANIDALADAVGFRYKRIANTRDFSHPATIVVLTPEGKVSRYLPGIPENIGVQARTVRLSLVEAGGRGIGSAIDWFVLTCYHYDSKRGTYALQAQRLMSLGGTLAALLLAIFLIPRWIRDALRPAP